MRIGNRAWPEHSNPERSPPLLVLTLLLEVVGNPAGGTCPTSPRLEANHLRSGQVTCRDLLKRLVWESAPPAKR